jgi:hypothetical protein
MNRVTVSAMRAHIECLAERHQIHVFPYMKRLDQGRSFRELEEVYISPVRSILSYAVALHEIGHVLGRHQTSRRVMVRERWAWHWARANALVWTPRLDAHADASLAYYAPRAAKMDRDWKPVTIAYQET